MPRIAGHFLTGTTLYAQL